ncbi:MAG TPA: SH3 domain-containing protein [Thermomicrobiales bacterium]|nr:SH3 domain-containing protein [Thermomicrobiales bacterium]
MNGQTRISRRHFAKATALGSVLLGGGGAALLTVRPASAQNGDVQYVCNSNDVNVRDDYGLSSNVIGTLYVGDVVNYLGDSIDADGYTWMLVNKAGTGLNGWVASAFLGGGSPGGWPEDTPVHVTSDNVNLRFGAGLGYGVVGTFDTGTNAWVVAGPQSADGYTWYKISMIIDGQGAVGWMADDFLAWGHNGGGNDGGTSFPIGAWMMTTTDLNLRSGAGTGYGVIGVYPEGTAATVLDGPVSANGYQWYRVEIADDGNVGWFAGEFLTFAPTEPTGTRVRVADGPLNVRSEPSLSGSVILTVETGATGRIVDASFVRADGYTWVSVEWFNQAGTVGWVANDFLAWDA